MCSEVVMHRYLGLKNTSVVCMHGVMHGQLFIESPEQLDS